MSKKDELGAVEVTVYRCRCRCGHEWTTKGLERPRVCPKCKSANWDRPKKFERKG
jgi:predicted Zn-ribbon and HTH transcriptional regulator